MSALAGLTASPGASLLQSLTPVAARALGYQYQAAAGTGLKPFVGWAQEAGLLNAQTLAAVIPTLPTLFGGYPYPENTASEIVPCAIFIAVFAILAVGCFWIFFGDFRVKHNFFLMFGLGWFCFMKVIGFACRLAWNKKIISINVGIASVAFIQVAQLVLLVLNQILGHRIFTWRHPETGYSWWFNLFLDGIYFLVMGIIAMAILGQALPYLYFMTASSYKRCDQVMQAAAVLNLVYALLPFGVIFLAFLFRPGQLTATPWKNGHYPWQKGRGNENLPPVFQASWIHSASTFSYPKKGSQVTIYKDEPAAKAIRIMPSREPPSNGRHEPHSEPMHPRSPRFLVGVLTALVGTLGLSLNTCFRVAACFTGRGGQPIMTPTFSYVYWVTHPYVMYIFYGGVEALVLILYMLMRVDLRFYIPDMAKSAKKNPHPYNGSDDYNEPKPQMDVEYTTPPTSA